MFGEMASKIAVVHIGTHKTGTTSLQSMIARNETYFAEQGLYYPTAGRAGDGHHNLAWELNGDERYDPTVGSFADLTNELRQTKPRAVLLSSEDFEYLHLRPESLRNFRRRLSRLGYKTHVLVVLRRPSEYLESLYVELRKHGLEEEFDDFLARALADGGVVFRGWDFRVNYKQLVPSFAAVFGRRAVHVLRYDTVDSVAPLLDACGRLLTLPLSPVADWERFNQRLSVVRASTGDPPVDRDGPRSAEARVQSLTPLIEVERDVIHAFHHSVNELVRHYPLPGDRWLSRRRPLEHHASPNACLEGSVGVSQTAGLGGAPCPDSGGLRPSRSASGIGPARGTVEHRRG
jgi:hypothetical protein